MRKIFVLLLLASLLTCRGGKTEKRDLSFNLTEGQVYTGKIAFRQRIYQSLSSRIVENIQNSTSTMRFRVHGSSRDILRLETVYTSLHLELKTSLLNIRFVSDAPAADPGLEALRTFLGEPFYLNVSPGGELLSIDGIKSIVNRIIKEQTLSAEVTTAIITFFNEKEVKNNFMFLFGYFPGKKIAEGEAWECENEVVVNTTVYRVANEWTRIAGNDTESVLLALESSFRENTIRGKQTGELLLDLKSGWIKEGKINQDLTTDLLLSSSGRKSGTINLVSEILISLQPEKPGNS